MTTRQTDPQTPEPLKLDVYKGSFQSAPLAPAVEPEPTDIEALLKEADDYWGVFSNRTADLVIRLRDALRAEATARQQLEAEIDRMRETLMFEQETGARIDDARQQAEQERDALKEANRNATS
jgi:hypothetical protein